MLTTTDLVFEDGVESYLSACREIAEKADNLFMFGSARGGGTVYSLLHKWKLDGKILYVVDNDKLKQGQNFHGREIISAEKLCGIFEEYKNAEVIIASGSAHVIQQQLMDMGFPENRLHPFAVTMLPTAPTPFQFLSEKKDLIDDCYKVFADDKSRDVFISLLNYKMTRNDAWLKNIWDNEHEQYFDKVMGLRDDESFVDCGAYIGDTLEEYAAHTDGKWKDYYAFEADLDVYKILMDNITSKGYENVYPYNIGCWDCTGELQFEATGSGNSQIGEQGNCKIRVDTLDKVLAEKRVSVIKMDIEGAEQKALRGAEGIIREQGPKLAISSYHSMDDFLRIPLLLRELRPDYRIYLRHYRALTDSETICYAV